MLKKELGLALLILVIGGIIGVLFITLLRRTLVVDADLPYPESKACAAIVKAGQSSETGARYVFGAMGVGILIQLFKDSAGLKLFRRLPPCRRPASASAGSTRRAGFASVACVRSMRSQPGARSTTRRSARSGRRLRSVALRTTDRGRERRRAASRSGSRCTDTEHGHVAALQVAATRPGASRSR